MWNWDGSWFHCVCVSMSVLAACAVYLICVHGYVYPITCMETREDTMACSVTLPYGLETGCLTWLQASPNDTCCFSSITGVSGKCGTARSLQRCWNLNSGPHSCTANTLNPNPNQWTNHLRSTYFYHFPCRCPVAPVPQEEITSFPTELFLHLHQKLVTYRHMCFFPYR